MTRQFCTYSASDPWFFELHLVSDTLNFGSLSLSFTYNFNEYVKVQCKKKKIAQEQTKNPKIIYLVRNEQEHTKWCEHQ